MWFTPRQSNSYKIFDVIKKGVADSSGRSLAGIVGLNPAAAGMDVRLFCVFVLSDRGLCDGPITRPEESHRV
jgi:hypothetical protein